MLEPSGASRAEEPVQSAGHVLKLGDRCCFGQAELAARQRVHGGGRLRGGVCGLYGVFADGQLLGHPGHRHSRVDHLLDAACPLGVGEVLLLIVSDDLVHDAVDSLLAGIAGCGRQHIDRNAGQPDFAGGKGAPLAVADAD